MIAVRADTPLGLTVAVAAALIDQLRGERDRARATAVALENRLAAVAALHVASRVTLHRCRMCGDPLPCATRQALDGAE